MRQVMINAPKTLPATASMAEVRAAFEDDHLHLLLIVDEHGRLRGTVDRADPGVVEPDAVAPHEPAVRVATLEGRTIAPDTNADGARRLLFARGERRRAVVDERGRLLGLLCLKRSGSGFCSDAGVAARGRGAAVGQLRMPERPVEGHDLQQ
ncbi:MAG TPA: CBS domain-containing protein [Acidimicrobiales bacterium]|nr:CBS domain-containing protein [Acidimicrobiales bacterium]